MHVMVATDGSLDAKKAAAFAANLTGGDGSVTVLTVVEVPRQMLDDMRRASADATATGPVDVDPEYRRTQAGEGPVTHWVGDDAIVASYVNRAGAERTAELVAELEAAGVDHTVLAIEGESAARSVLAEAAAQQPDILCLGTRGIGLFEGLLGSVSTKVIRLATCSVLLVR